MPKLTHRSVVPLLPYNWQKPLSVAKFVKARSWSHSRSSGPVAGWPVPMVVNPANGLSGGSEKPFIILINILNSAVASSVWGSRGKLLDYATVDAMERWAMVCLFVLPIGKAHLLASVLRVSIIQRLLPHQMIHSVRLVQIDTFVSFFSLIGYSK
jgi:hypothetical protein